MNGVRHLAAASAARAQTGLRESRWSQDDPERGDVPGWVLITLMTAGLVTGLWALAGPQLGAVFTDAISSVTGP
jgi:hypothetical protein